jgi:membrane-associated phospholipid phosphatase
VILIAGLLLFTGGFAVLTGVTVHGWASGHPGLLQDARRRADDLARWPRRHHGHNRGRRASEQPRGHVLPLALALGITVVGLAAVWAGALVDAVTDGDGVAVVDHPIAGFVAAHRVPALTSVMRAVSMVGGPAGITVIALAAGLLLSIAWPSWTPTVVLGVTDAGATALTLAFKAALGRARPPLAQAVAAADGYGFPSGHAATAVAVCGAAAWLCSTWMRSWRGRIAVWAAAAMLAGLVGISRIYLGVHWTTDVIGGWAFGVLWLAVVVSCWAAYSRARIRKRN